jgi:UDP-N-acetylmuramate dehydrogenase
MTFIKALRNVLPAKAIFTNEPMAKYTTFKIGGPADVLTKPDSSLQLKQIYELCRNNHWPFTLLGEGSNVLVSDDGIRGMVVLTTNLNTVQIEKPANQTRAYITAGAGVKLSKLAETACKEGLKGLEFLHAIPGSVGGAVYMNAGAYDQFVSGVCTSVTLLQNDKLTNIPVGEMGFDYRTSRVQKDGGIIIDATFRLVHGETDKIRAVMNDINAQRKTKHPQEPSAGSTFKNPQGYAAWQLIKNAGMTGHTVGGAQVSEKHSNFVINKNNATAEDICRLLDEIRKKVHEHSGIWLEPEVKVIGRKYPWQT